MENNNEIKNEDNSNAETKEINPKDPVQVKENKKAKKKIAILVGAIVVLGIAYGAYWKLYSSHFEETEDAYVSADQNAITSQIASTVVALNIQDGQIVQQGFNALSLDKTDYNINLQKAESDLARAVRSYGSLQLNITESQNSLNQKLNDLNKANDDLKRDSASYNAGVLSQQDYLNSKHKWEQAQLLVTGAKSSYTNTRIQAVSKNIYSHPDVEKSINAYKQAYIDAHRADIQVPVDGVVARRAVYIGQKVAPNQTLFTVVNLNNEWADVNLKESQLENVKIGQSVTLKSDVNGKEYKGYVSSIGAGSGSALSLLPAQNATGNWIKIVQRVPIRVDFDKQSLKDNGTLPIGTSVRINIDTRQTKQIDLPVGQKTEIYKLDDKILEEQINKIVSSNIVWK